MTVNLQVIMLAAIALLGGGGGIYSMATLGAQRRKLLTEATSTLTDSALQFVAAVKSDAQAVRDELVDARRAAERAHDEARDARRASERARDEAREARREASECGHLVQELRTQVDELISKLATTAALINDPAMTIDRLRTDMPNMP